MKKVFNIQIQRADNGFIAIAQDDTPGIKSKKSVATSEDEIKTAVKDFIDHMFDEPPPKEKEQEEKQSGTPTDG